jgi:hypothetical protein
VPALLGREGHVGEQAAHLVGVVVLDRRLEPLARRQRLRELPP